LTAFSRGTFNIESHLALSHPIIADGVMFFTHTVLRGDVNQQPTEAVKNIRFMCGHFPVNIYAREKHMNIRHQFVTSRPVIAKGFLLANGTRFTVVGRRGRGYVIRLHNKIRRELVVGSKFLTIAKAQRHDFSGYSIN
jgi:hypothetical protein